MNQLWKLQHSINKTNMEQDQRLLEMINALIKIVEDHEADMLKMADRINELTKEVSKLKEGR